MSVSLSVNFIKTFVNVGIENCRVLSADCLYVAIEACSVMDDRF